MKVNCCVFVDFGFEETAKKEINDLIGKSFSHVSDGCVIFSCSLEDCCKFVYFSQIAKRVLVLFSEFEIFSDLNKTIGSFNSVEKILPFNLKSFILRVDRIGSHDFSSPDVEREFSKAIDKVSSGNSDYREFLSVRIVNNKGFFGLDLSGFDLDKRDYKISISPLELKPTFYYHLLRVSSSETGSFLDPFILSGSEPIELALYRIKKSHNFFRKKEFNFLKSELFKNLNFDILFSSWDEIKNKTPKIFGVSKKEKSIFSARKNSVVAEVENFLELKYLDSKSFNLSKKFDRIVGHIPGISKNFNKKLFINFLNKLLPEIKNNLSPEGEVFIATSSGKELLDVLNEFKYESKLVQSLEVSKRKIDVISFS